MHCEIPQRVGACLGLLLMLALGCDRTPTSDGNTSSTPSPSVPSASDAGVVNGSQAAAGDNGHTAVVIEDRLQRKVEFARPPQRIVSLSPATTELLFALGLGESLVGVTEHCNYPPAAQQITRVGAGTLEGISREMIVSVEPDLILCKSDNHQPLVETFEKLNIPIMAIGPESLEELFQEAQWLGKICDREEAAAALVQSMQSRLALIRKAVTARTSDQKPMRVFYEVWDEPLMAAGPGSFIDELLRLAGLENVVSDTSRRYPRVSAEVIVQRNPEVILAPTTHFEKVDISTFAKRPGWAEVAAVRDEKIFLIDGDRVSRCGPRLLDALEQIVVSVYPGIVLEPTAASGNAMPTKEARMP